MERYCPQCGNMYDGSKRHDCPAVGSAADWFLTDTPKEKKAPKKPARQAKPPKQDKVADTGNKSLRERETEYARDWREKNREHVRAYKREYMRRYRERMKDN